MYKLQTGLRSLWFYRITHFRQVHLNIMADLHGVGQCAWPDLKSLLPTSFFHRSQGAFSESVGGKIREQHALSFPLHLWMSRRQICCLWCMHAKGTNFCLFWFAFQCSWCRGQNPVLWASQLSATTELRTSHKPQPFKVPVLAFHHTVKTMFIKTWWQTPLCWPHSP